MDEELSERFTFRSLMYLYEEMIAEASKIHDVK